MKIIINRDSCIGAGQCVLAAPELFDQSEDDGLVVLRNAAASEADRAGAEAAAFACPTRSITIAD